MKRKKALCVCAMFAAVLLFFTTAAPPFDSSAALTASQANINKLQQQLKQIEADKKALEKKQEQLSNDKEKQLEIKDSLDESIKLAESEIEATLELIDELSEQIFITEQRLEDKKAEEADKYAQFKQRLRVMYEDGEMSYLEIILASGTLSQMLARVDIINSIMENDKHIMAELEDMRLSIEADKEALVRNKTEVERQKDSLNTKKKQLEKKYKDADDYLKKISAQESMTANKIDDLAIEEERIAKEIAKMAAELARQQSAQYVGGEFTWPLPGYTYISSRFGMRDHPITGQYKLHTGIDIPAPRGTSIKAANSGVVLMAHHNTAYGYMVTINHGGGFITLYAHMTKYIVSAGQTVEKGQTIGYVGSTGWSTGPHLHFEIQKDGKHVDPLNYYKLR